MSSASDKKSRKKLIKRSKKFFIRYGIVATNLALLSMIGFFILNNRPQSDLPINSEVSNNSIDSKKTNGPIDSIAAADIAANIAFATQSPIATLISNQADSERIATKVSSSEEVALAKPQVISTGEGSINTKDIITHVTENGETVSSIAAKYNVTSKSIRDSNNLNGDRVNTGVTLRIPPRDRNGVVHKVEAGDTPQSIASKYNANADRIVAFNDAEISGLQVGSYIFVPDGAKPDYVPSVPNINASLAFFNPVYGGNSYARGYCTWYVASRIEVPSNWGNANTWDNGARASGWNVSKIPVPGAILQTDVGWAGHVGIVEEVNEDGTQMKFSDMNGTAGFGRVYYSGWTPSSKYIYLYK